MKALKFVSGSSSKRITFIISFTIVSLFLLIPAYLSCQSKSGDMEINNADKTAIVDWINSKLTNYYIKPETAEKMVSRLTTQLAENKYEEDTTVKKFLRHLTKDLQGISKDAHLRLMINTNIPDSIGDGTEDAIPDYIVGEKRENFQFREIRILEGNVGYLRFDAFRNVKYAAPTAVAAMNFLANSDAVIFDLRYNGGGYGEMVQLMLSYLFEKPEHYLNSYSRYDDKTKEWWTLAEVAGPRMPSVPVYVLTSNKYTFSAAEEFAFVLQNFNKGTIVGERTTGGANSVDFYYLRKYSIEFRIPTANSRDPETGKSWEGSGIEPDVKCESEKALGIAHELALEKLAGQASGSRQDELEWLSEYQKALNHPFAIDSSALQNYTGKFGPVTISLYYGRLSINMPDEQIPKPIFAVSETEFVIEGDESTRVKFVMENGQAVAVTGIRMNGPLATFKKKEKPVMRPDRNSRKASFKFSANADTSFPASIGIEFILIEGGEFEMGDVFGEGSRAEIPVHKIILNPYYLSKTEITFDQYDRFCEAKGKQKPDDEGWGRGRRPVINVSWYDAVEFCQWLSHQTGKFIDLPTEAEWEFAARERGKKVRFGNGSEIADPEKMNFNGEESGKKSYSVVGIKRENTLPVASFPANALGLFDMSGNVWEYCADWYGKEYYRNSPELNPQGPRDGQYKVIRGGSFSVEPAWIRNTARAAWTPDSPDKMTGFRVVLLP